VSNCRSCRAPVTWVLTVNGRKMPLDPKPTDDGNVAVRRDERGDMRGHVLREGEEPKAGERRFTSHFATCPNAGQHRGR
jgi:hypothetical protein